MKLVPFKDEFKYTMTVVMILDYAACWFIEIVFKYLFSDLKARGIAVRREDQLEREKIRKAEELLKLEEAKKKKLEEEEKAQMEKVAEFERRLRARMGGRPAE